MGLILERKLLAVAAAAALALLSAAFLIAAAYVWLAELFESAAAGAAVVGAVLLVLAGVCWLLSHRRPRVTVVATAAAPEPGPGPGLEEAIAAPIALALSVIKRQPLAALAVFAAAGFAVAERPKEAMGFVRELARLAGSSLRDPHASTHA